MRKCYVKNTETGKNNNIFDVVNKSLKNDIAFFKQIYYNKPASIVPANQSLNWRNLHEKKLALVRGLWLLLPACPSLPAPLPAVAVLFPALALVPAPAPMLALRP